MTTINRRKILGILASGSLGLGGCLSQAIPNPDESTETPSDDAGSIEIGDTTVETTESGCAAPDHERADIDLAENTIEVNGVITAPNPCHKAILENVLIQNRELTITVDVESSLEDGAVCIECVGGVEYTAIIEVNNVDDLSKITIDHATGGEFGLSQEQINEENVG